jgi:hypothetical protein
MFELSCLFFQFSILIQPLLESYSTALSAATYEDLWQSVLNWVDQYCSLIALRPGKHFCFVLPFRHNYLCFVSSGIQFAPELE